MHVAEVQAEMAEVTLLAQRTLLGVQRLAQQLRPTLLDDLGLSAALHWLAEEMQRGTATRIIVTANEPRVALSEQQALRETMLFRVAQEALTNALRYSAAATVHLILRRTTRHLTLTVRDDGTGFSLTDHGAGTGLGSMQERMTLIGGRCAIRSVQGVGTTIIARVPL